MPLLQEVSFSSNPPPPPLNSPKLPWYNRTGWLGIKHQLTYLFTPPPQNKQTTHTTKTYLIDVFLLLELIKLLLQPPDFLSQAPFLALSDLQYVLFRICLFVSSFDEGLGNEVGKMWKQLNQFLKHLKKINVHGKNTFVLKFKHVMCL